MARLPYGRWSIDPPVDAASIAQSDVLATLIGVASANRVVTFADAVIAGLGFIASAVVKTVHLADGSVTNAKLRDSAGLSVMGRSANSAGSPGDIVAGSDNTVLQRSSNTLSFTKVSRSSMSNSSPTSVIGRSANSSGAPADIQATSNNRVLKRKSNSLQWAQVESADIANGAVGSTELAPTQRLERLADVSRSSPTPVMALVTIYVAGSNSIGDVVSSGVNTTRRLEGMEFGNPTPTDIRLSVGTTQPGSYKLIAFIFGDSSTLGEGVWLAQRIS